jgi:hypothetical protein
MSMLERRSSGGSFVRSVSSSIPRNWPQLNHGLDDRYATHHGIGRPTAFHEDRRHQSSVSATVLWLKQSLGMSGGGIRTLGRSGCGGDKLLGALQ